MKKIIYITLCFILLLSTVTFTGCKKTDKLSKIDKEKIEQLALPNEKDNLIYFDLYFDASKDGKTVEIGKEERVINKEELIGGLIVQELIKGPSFNSEFTPILPNDTRLLSFSIKDGVACINFSKEAKINMSEVKEKACLLNIFKSLTKALPSVEKVQILIENKNIDSLGGNYNILSPYSESDIDDR